MTTADLVSIFLAGLIAGGSATLLPVVLFGARLLRMADRARWANWWAARDARNRRVRL